MDECNVTQREYKYLAYFGANPVSLAQYAVETVANGPSQPSDSRTNSKPMKKIPASITKWLSHTPTSEPERS